MKKALHNLHMWRVGNEKANQQEYGDVKLFNRQTLRGMECMPPFSYSKALCRSSLLLSDFCTLASGALLVTISYDFFTIKLSARLYDKGHNGFTHSQCTSLQSKEREHCTLKMVKLVLVLPYISTAGHYGLRKNIFKSLWWISTNYKKTLNTRHQFTFFFFIQICWN